MKLLDRKFVTVNVAEQKRQQIEEGLMIARKIDGLRVQLSELEKTRSLFIENTEEELKKKTAPLYTKLKKIEKQIQDAQVIRNELREPLDQEWELLNQHEADYEKKQIDLEELSETLKNREINIGLKEAEIEANARKQQLLLEEAKTNVTESRQDRDEAKKIVIIAQEKESVINKTIFQKMSNIDLKERENEFHQNNNGKIAEQLKIKELALMVKEKEIADRYATLLRTEERVHGK